MTAAVAFSDFDDMHAAGWSIQQTVLDGWQILRCDVVIESGYLFAREAEERALDLYLKQVA